MKMMGMSVRSASRFCRSRPLSPGSVTSSTKQQGLVGWARHRNSCADANVSGCQPAVRNNSSSDSRTETSSSTTKTIDVTSGMVGVSIEQEAIEDIIVYGARVTFLVIIVAMRLLPYPQCRLERVEQ